MRYPRELRSNPEQIEREVLVPIMGGAMVPLGQVAKVVVARGTPGIRTENALLSAYIFVDIRDRDIGSYVADARKAVADQVKFPAGYYITWSGQFEAMERAIEKMKIVVPVTLLLIFLLLYLNFRRLTETFIVMLSVPFALVGGVWLMWWLNYNLSVAAAMAASTTAFLRSMRALWRALRSSSVERVFSSGALMASLGAVGGVEGRLRPARTGCVRHRRWPAGGGRRRRTGAQW